MTATTMTFPACHHPAWAEMSEIIYRNGQERPTLSLDAEVLSIIPANTPFLWSPGDEQTELVFGYEYHRHILKHNECWYGWDGEVLQRNHDPDKFWEWMFRQTEHYQVVRQRRTFLNGRPTIEMLTTWERHPCDQLAVMRSQRDVHCMRICRDFELLFDREIN